MRISNENQFYVSVILDDSLVIVCKVRSKRTCLKINNARKRWFNRYVWVIKYKTQEDLSRTYLALRQEGIAFSADQHGWGPSETFEYLRTKRYIYGSFKEISWLGPGKFIVRIK